MVSTKIFTSTIVLNIGNNKKCSWAQNDFWRIMWHWKQVTAAENSALHHKNKLYFKIDYNKKNIYVQLKSKMYIHIAESAHFLLFYLVRGSQEGSYKMHAIVYLVLTWIRYFTLQMFTCSPQEKIVEFIKKIKFKNLNLLKKNCLVIVVHESLVCPEQLNVLLSFGKILQLTLILWFSSIFVYFVYCNYYRRFKLIIIVNYYRRFKRSLMIQKEKPCIKPLNRIKMFTFFLLCLNIYIF